MGCRWRLPESTGEDDGVRPLSSVVLDAATRIGLMGSAQQGQGPGIRGYDAMSSVFASRAGFIFLDSK